MIALVVLPPKIDVTKSIGNLDLTNEVVGFTLEVGGEIGSGLGSDLRVPVELLTKLFSSSISSSS